MAVLSKRIYGTMAVFVMSSTFPTSQLTCEAEEKLGSGGLPPEKFLTLRWVTPFFLL